MIEIKPIFYQTKDIWNEFAVLEMETCEKKYRYQYDENHIKWTVLAYESDFMAYDYNFAFGAFDNGKMLGFVSGHILSDKELYIRSLYVKSEFHGQKIGQNLLKKAENTHSSIANLVHIVSLSGATSFYKKNGYTFFQDDRLGYKNIDYKGIGVIPLFGWSLKLRKYMNMPVDTKLLKSLKHCPMFIYVSSDKKIDGIIARKTSGEEVLFVNKAKGNVMANLYTTSLRRALVNYR